MRSDVNERRSARERILTAVLLLGSLASGINALLTLARTLAAILHGGH